MPAAKVDSSDQAGERTAMRDKLLAMLSAQNIGFTALLNAFFADSNKDDLLAKIAELTNANEAWAEAFGQQEDLLAQLQSENEKTKEHLDARNQEWEADKQRILNESGNLAAANRKLQNTNAEKDAALQSALQQVKQLQARATQYNGTASSVGVREHIKAHQRYPWFEPAAMRDILFDMVKRVDSHSLSLTGRDSKCDFTHPDLGECAAFSFGGTQSGTLIITPTLIIFTRLGGRDVYNQVFRDFEVNTLDQTISYFSDGQNYQTNAAFYFNNQMGLNNAAEEICNIFQVRQNDRKKLFNAFQIYSEDRPEKSAFNECFTRNAGGHFEFPVVPPKGHEYPSHVMNELTDVIHRAPNSRMHVIHTDRYGIGSYAPPEQLKFGETEARYYKIADDYFYARQSVNVALIVNAGFIIIAETDDVSDIVMGIREVELVPHNGTLLYKPHSEKDKKSVDVSFFPNTPAGLQEARKALIELLPVQQQIKSGILNHFNLV